MDGLPKDCVGPKPAGVTEKKFSVGLVVGAASWKVGGLSVLLREVVPIGADLDGNDMHHAMCGDGDKVKFAADDLDKMNRCSETVNSVSSPDANMVISGR